ncbi:HDOD domain-containing protein [Clostridium malenominatum]|uniref:HDOD domain-containing protein n=1 Tax=Clostridium malenominatum TaxID=1539 RepID=A0ABN1J1C6_9CLOT
MEKEKIFDLLENSDRLPKLSKDVSEILEMLKNPVGFDIDELIEKIYKVDNLNELMLKNLNSGYFQTNKKFETIKESIVYFGMQAVQNFIIFFITLQLFSHDSSTNKSNRTFTMSHYWNHVLGTSVASCMLSAKIKYGDKYKLFSYGLIHDIGIAVLDTCLPELIDEVTEKLKNGMHQIVAERLVLGGLTHADIGGWVCRKWNIRDDITNIVEHHHTPFLAKLNPVEMKLLYLADAISTEYYEKLLGVNLNHGISTKIMDSLGITQSDMNSAIEALPGEIQKLRNYLTV